MCTNASVPYNNFKKSGQNFRALPLCISVMLQATGRRRSRTSRLSRRIPRFLSSCGVATLIFLLTILVFCAFLCNFFRRFSDCSTPVRSFSHFLFLGHRSHPFFFWSSCSLFASCDIVATFVATRGKVEWKNECGGCGPFWVTHKGPHSSKRVHSDQISRNSTTRKKSENLPGFVVTLWRAAARG